MASWALVLPSLQWLSGFCLWRAIQPRLYNSEPSSALPSAFLQTKSNISSHLGAFSGRPFVYCKGYLASILLMGYTQTPAHFGPEHQTT